MIIQVGQPPKRSGVHAVTIQSGTVFTGTLKTGGTFGVTKPTGTFLKIDRHIVDLETNEIHGCGQAGGSHEFRIIMVDDYIPYHNATLDLKE